MCGNAPAIRRPLLALPVDGFLRHFPILAFPPYVIGSIVERDQRAYTALGATGAQSLVPFESQSLSALESLAQVGGLSTTLADPTGVFILRSESASVANAIMGRDDLRGSQRMVYALDLTAPDGLFEARDFQVRDGDTIFVTEAPFSQWTKAVNAVTGTAGAADSLTSIGSSD